MANIVKYRDNTWRARVRKNGYAQQSKTFETKGAAEKWARALEAEMDKGGQVQNNSEAKGLTVRSLFERYLNEQTPLKETSKGERNTIKRLLRTAEFMPRQLNQLKPDDIRAWRDQRLVEVQASSVAREFTTISSVITFAIKEWGAPLQVNPARMVSRPKGADVERDKRWTDADINKVLKAVGWKEDVVPKEPRDYVGWAVLVAVETAMRAGEISLLTVADFNPKEKYVFLKTTKNGDSRYVPLSKKAIKYFEHLTKGKKPEENIFPPVGTLGVYFREARNAAGLAGELVFHDLRHEAATRLSNKLTNVLELSAVTGHRSLKSLKRYYNPTPAEIAGKLD
jgi:integrase